MRVMKVTMPHTINRISIFSNLSILQVKILVKFSRTQACTDPLKLPFLAFLTTQQQPVLPHSANKQTRTLTTYRQVLDWITIPTISLACWFPTSPAPNREVLLRPSNLVELAHSITIKVKLRRWWWFSREIIDITGKGRQGRCNKCNSNRLIWWTSRGEGTAVWTRINSKMWWPIIGSPLLNTPKTTEM